MQWYKTGNVSVVNGLAVVSGSGALWLNQVNAGDIFTLDASTLYEILTVDGNNQITLATPYVGASAAGQSYAILRNFTSTTNAILASKIAELLDDWQTREIEMVNWQSGTATGGPLLNGEYPMTDAQGNSISVKSIAKIQADAIAAAGSGVTEAAASASAAAASETSASSSAAAAATSATSASSSAAAAATSATSSSDSATSASGSATSALSSKNAAATSETNAASSWLIFSARYLGAFASAPTLDNNGNALIVGATYLDTTLSTHRSWTGSTWVSIPSIVASSIPNTPAGNIAATNIQAAIDELDAEKASIGLLGSRNIIINGNFVINQRGYVSAAAVGAGLYGHDRWKMAASVDTYSFSTTENKTTITIPAGKVLRQVVEGINIQSGTHVLSWEGTAQAKIGAGSYGDSGVTGILTGGTDVQIEFGPGTVANVQLEPGGVATPFGRRQVGTELALCQRYYEVTDSGFSDIICAQYASAYARFQMIPFKVIKRATPVVICTLATTVGHSGTPGALYSAYASAFGITPTFNWTGGAVGSAFVGRVNWEASAEL